MENALQNVPAANALQNVPDFAVFSLGTNPKTTDKPQTPLQRKKGFKATVGSGKVDRFNKRVSSAKKAKGSILNSKRGGGTLLKSPPPTGSCLFGPGWDENREPPPDDAMAL